MDRLLLALGVGVWLVAGAPRWGEILGSAPTLRDAAWTVVWAAFLVFFAVAQRHRGTAWARGATGLQSGCALALLPLGMPHFEGALLAVVGAQTLLVVPWAWALTWVGGQAIPLFATILPSHAPLGATKATGEYLAFSLFAMTAFALRDRERRQRERLMRVQAELLGTRSLLRDTVAMAEQDRIRRELHDAFGHHLSATSGYLDAARRGGAHDALERAREALDRLIAESRATLRGLRPEVDLEEALSSLQGSIPGVELVLDLAEVRTDRPELAWAVFRAAQEAMTNAHRHGGATRVRVTGRSAGDELRVDIENDGAPAPALTEGLGLSGMRSRLAELDGALEIDPGPPFTLRLRFARA